MVSPLPVIVLLLLQNEAVAQPMNTVNRPETPLPHGLKNHYNFAGINRYRYYKAGIVLRHKQILAGYDILGAEHGLGRLEPAPCKASVSMR